MLRSLRILAACSLAACALLAAGCGNACLDLASQICVCLPDDGTRTACNQRAKNDQSIWAVRPEDIAYCQAKLDANACDCTKLNTPEGRAACGLSYQPD